MTIFEDTRCRHNVPYASPCHECLQVALGRASAPRLNECHRGTHITGERCPHPVQQSEEGCEGCCEYLGVFTCASPKNTGASK